MQKKLHPKELLTLFQSSASSFFSMEIDENFQEMTNIFLFFALFFLFISRSEAKNSRKKMSSQFMQPRSLI